MTTNRPKHEEDFLEERKRYGEDYQRTIVPHLERAKAFLQGTVEYGKFTVSSLFLVNVGGLASMVAIQPLVKDIDQAWLAQAWPIAVAFGLGLAFAIIAGALSYWNFASNSLAAVSQAEAEDVWLKQWYFPHVDKTTTQTFSQLNYGARAKAIRRSGQTYRLAFAAAIISAVAASFGGGLLAVNVSHLAQPTMGKSVGTPPAR